MARKVTVRAKAFSRKALGIANAYVALNPNTTVEDLRKAFPLSICSKPLPGLTSFFYTKAEYDAMPDDHTKYKMHKEFPIALADGTQVIMYSMWIEDDINTMIPYAEKYGITVADAAEGEKMPKEGYVLEGDLAPQQVTVRAKAFSRKALGIANAYVMMNPKATVEDLRKAFPLSICSKPLPGLTSFFYTKAEYDAMPDDHTKYKMHKEFPIALADGTQVIMYSMWIEDDINTMIPYAEKYGITVTDAAEDEKLGKIGYALDYDGTPAAKPAPTPKKEAAPKEKPAASKPEPKKEEPAAEKPVASEPAPKKATPAMEFVDLGLPSGVKWASCNLGASKPEEYGNYYAWGETKTKETYDEENSDWYGVSYEELQKQGVIDANGNLTAQYDVVTQKLGKGFRMPTKDEYQELKDNCTWIWTEQDGVDGYKVKGKNGKSIFLPAAGFRSGSSSYIVGVNYNWSSTAYADSNQADTLFFTSDYYNWYYDNRYSGISVRPVSDK